MAKSGLEILTDLVEQIRLLNKKVDLLDQNVKVLLNKDRTQPPPKPEPKPQPPPQTVKPQIQAIEPPKPKDGKVVVNKGDKLIVKNSNWSMVSGKISTVIDGTPTYVMDVNVKIYNDANELVKETKTNKSGVWMCSLVPGRYVAEFSGKHKGRDILQNKNFTVPPDVERFEVP